MTNKNISGAINRILSYSAIEAIRLNSLEVLPEHLLLAILYDKKNCAYNVLVDLNIPTDMLKQTIEDCLLSDSLAGTRPEVDGNGTLNISFSTQAKNVLSYAFALARSFGRSRPISSDLLLSMMRDNTSQTYSILNDMKITYNDIVNRININASRFTDGANFAEDDDMDSDADESSANKNPGGTSTATEEQHKSQANSSATPTLDKYAIDMTKAAAENKLDPVVGREKEIERLSQILSRRKKNNPVLIGEPGVGKSAIVEGLAIRIIQHRVARVLFDKRIMSLDMASIVAGTKYRGQFEERIKSLVDELTNHPEIILFIDELHTIVGAGNASGTMDAANLLKPALARGVIQCIGATTLDEYRKNIEKDGALERRFQKIIVEPTSAAETLEILNNIKSRYESHHNVIYTPEALEACVKLTDRYLSDRQFPDKAIDALDEAGSRVHISLTAVPKKIEEIEQQIEEVAKNKVSAARAQNFESAASYRDIEQQLHTQLTEAKSEWQTELEMHPDIVDADKVAEVVAMMTGVPVERIAKAEGARLLDMGNELRNVIVGQDTAIDTIVKAIRRNRVGLKDPNRPIGTFLFLGPTGVGKTHLAKKLSELLFDSPDALIRLDMSEYMEKFTVSRLVGAPPGYVGYDEGGQLTEKVRRHPYSVVLLDEIEKAHSDVFNMLLQVLDEGRLTDSNGRNVDFKNTILIMTSNVGSRELKDFGSGVGFNTESRGKEYSDAVIQKALNKTFSPEFINRIDDIVMFDSLDKDAVGKIIDIELKGFYQRISDLGHELIITDSAKKYIIEKGFDKNYGARPLKRAIQQYVEDELATILLQNTDVKSKFTIDYDKKNDKIATSSKPLLSVK